MRLTGYPTSCLTLAVTLVKTTRQQRETLPIAGFALDADKWSGTGSISAGTRAMIWSTPARSIAASRPNQAGGEAACAGAGDDKVGVQSSGHRIDGVD